MYSLHIPFQKTLPKAFSLQINHAMLLLIQFVNHFIGFMLTMNIELHSNYFPCLQRDSILNLFFYVRSLVNTWISNNDRIPGISG